MTTPSYSDAFVKHVEHGVKLHGLFLKGLCDSEEADAIREEMDGTWYRMTKTEIEWYRGIAEDLNSLEGKYFDDFPGEAVFNAFQLQMSSMTFSIKRIDAGNLFSILKFLRIELSTQPSLERFIRGYQVNIYLDLQLEDVGLLISQKMQAHDFEFRLATFKALWNSGRKAEAIEQAAQLLSSDQQLSPEYVNNACEVLLEIGVDKSIVSVEEAIRNAMHDIREMRNSPPRLSAEDLSILSQLEASLASKLGALMGPVTTAKEFRAPGFSGSLLHKFAGLHSAA